MLSYLKDSISILVASSVTSFYDSIALSPTGKLNSNYTPFKKPVLNHTQDVEHCLTSLIDIPLSLSLYLLKYSSEFFKPSSASAIHEFGIRKLNPTIILKLVDKKNIPNEHGQNI